jgi:hypothetical protein
MAENHVCALCGAPVGADGQALPFASKVHERRRTATVTRATQPDDDPLKDLTPVERYAQAIDRRNALIHDRRTSERRGRRH